MSKTTALDLLVSLAAVFRVVTQRCWWGGALRDDPKNSCKGDYSSAGAWRFLVHFLGIHCTTTRNLLKRRLCWT